MAYKFKVPKTAKNLIIHESPTECKTIKNFLPKKYMTLTTFGHFMQSSSKSLNVNEKKWELKRYASKNKYTRNAIKNIKKAIKAVRKRGGTVYIATDNDREGESIASDVVDYFKLKKSEYKRMRVSDLNKIPYMKAIKKAEDDLDWNMVAAGKARRILDKYIGFKLTERLWTVTKQYKKYLDNIENNINKYIKDFKSSNKDVYDNNKNIKRKVDKYKDLDFSDLNNFNKRKGISIGRVQTPTLKLLVSKDLEKFKKDLNREQELYLIDKKGYEWEYEKNNKYGKKMKVMKAIYSGLKKAIDDDNIKSMSVKKISRRAYSKMPKTPMDTQKAQTSLNRVFNFSSKKTMKILQSLYEKGYTTYMRTDDIRVPKEYRETLKKIGKNNVKTWEYVQRNYKSEDGDTQGGHDAILPTAKSQNIDLDNLPGGLNSSEKKALEYIIRRSIAAFMEKAKITTYTYTLEVKFEHKGKEKTMNFKLKDKGIKKHGFLKIFKYNIDKYTKKIKYKEGEKIKLKKIKLKEKKVKLRGTYTEGSLVKELKKRGIGRPSTWEGIIDTLKKKKYLKSKKRLSLTPKGYWVYQSIKDNDKIFGKIFDLDFTAQMEEKLDDVANGKKTKKEVMDWIVNDVVKAGQKEFEKIKKQVGGSSSGGKGKAKIAEGYECPKCGSDMVVRTAKKSGKKFLGCSTYPDCKGVIWDYDGD